MRLWSHTFLVFFVVSCGPNQPESGRYGAGNAKPIGSDDANANPEDQSQDAKEDPATPAACPKYPVLFLHGLMGGARGSFIGVVKHFQGLGCKVMMPEVSPINSSEYRAKQVAEHIKKLITEAGTVKINIVAHSQGGLDARYAITHLGMAEDVATLSTLSTPHRGSEIADVVAKDMANPISKIFLSAIMGTMANVSNTDKSQAKDSAAAIRALSTSYMRDTFNPGTPDVPGILYQSWAAKSGKGSTDRIKSTLKPTQVYLAKVAGDNDGMVSVESSKWGEFRGVIDADHMDFGGKKSGDEGPGQFNHIKFYEALLKDLKSRGF